VAVGLEQAASRCGVLDAATDAHCADLIERTPGAFGPSTLALIESDMRPLHALTIDGFPSPTPQNVTSGRYPWSKPLLLVHAGEPEAPVSAFVDFVTSQGARRLLAMTGHCTA
jgi:phosphate transport system substrate-binding protein